MLDVVQSKALKIIAKTIASIQAELGVMPPSLRRTKLGFKYWIKAKNIAPKNHINLLKSLIRSLSVDTTNFEYPGPSLNLGKKF